MLRSRTWILGTVSVVLLLPAGCGAAVDGYWSGVAITPTGPLPLALTIPGRADRSSALLDAPPLGLTEQPMELRVTGNHLELRLDLEGRIVTAEAIVSGDSLVGMAHLGEQAFPLALARGRKPEWNYRTEPVVLRPDGVTLPATLYLPRSPRPVPGIVFVAGLTARGYATHFLADLLASRGIAVLTYERRGVGGATGDPRAGFEAHASDAAAAVNYLEQRPEIDPRRVGIRGQSQGAWLAVLAAGQVPVAFVIATGGGGIPPWQSELYAVPARMRADRLPAAAIEDARRYMTTMFEVAATGRGWDGLHSMMDELRRGDAGWLDRYAPHYETLESLQAVWKRDFSYDPAPALRALHCPVLALMGEHDVYAPPTANLQALDSLLTMKDRTLRAIAEATHDFHVLGAPLPLVSSEYLQTMMEWTVAHSGAGSSANRVAGHTIVSGRQHLSITVDSSLRYVGAIEFDIRGAAHAQRIVFADADSNATLRRLWVAQFEEMLPQHQGAYDALREGDRVRIGPCEFQQAAGLYRFASAIASKPGAEAERTRDFLLEKGLRLPDTLVVARFETQPERERRSEIVLFYWEDLRTASAPNAATATTSEFREAFAAKATRCFTIERTPAPR